MTIWLAHVSSHRGDVIYPEAVRWPVNCFTRSRQAGADAWLRTMFNPVQSHTFSGRTIRKVMGGGDFQLAWIFFFAHYLCRNFFFQVNPSARIFFQTNIAFFWTVKSWFINYVFVLFCAQRIQATLMQNLFENVHTVREEEATWSGRLPCAFFQSRPSGVPLPQPIIMMPYSIHQNSPSVVPSTQCQSKKKVPF